jgi:apolipoprotein N-acyltransferase
MKGFITKENLWYRIQQLIILVLHLILLKWMFYTLSNSGSLSTSVVFYHFIGMSIMGALLIRGSAYWARHHYIKEIKHEQETRK